MATPTSKYWHQKKVLVTGGAGFIGSHLVELLLSQGAKVTVTGRKPKTQAVYIKPLLNKLSYHCLDLLQPSSKLVTVFQDQHTIFHLAARVAGIEYNRHHPATMLRDNSQMTLNALEAARLAGVKQFQMVSSACVYPRHCTIPTPESEGFLNEPEPTNYGYGWAKRFSEILAKTYADEHKMKISIVRPYNAYGPRDDFDPRTSHVVPALIKRVVDGENPVVVWGDGSATRSFLYVEDFARGLLEAMEKYPVPDPVNIGTDEEISIKNLIKLIIKLSGSEAKIKFDTTKPNGQPRRNCDTTKASKKIGFKAKVSLEAGLTQTIKWYQDHAKKKKN